MQPDYSKVAVIALGFLAQAQVRITTPDLENAVAVRNWLAQIANGDLKVVRSTDLAQVQSNERPAPADV